MYSMNELKKTPCFTFRTWVTEVATLLDWSPPGPLCSNHPGMKSVKRKRASKPSTLDWNACHLLMWDNNQWGQKPQASSDMSRSPKPAESFVCQLALSTDFDVQDSLLPSSCGYCKDSAMPESVAAWTKIEHCFSQLYPAPLSLQQCYFLGGFGSYKSSQKWLLQGVWPIILIKCFPWPSTRDVAVWTRFSRSMASPRPNLCFFSGTASQTPWFGWQEWGNQNPPDVLKAISVQRCGFCDASLGKSSKQVFVREFEDSA